jgi:hypothetical protein
VEGVQSVAKPRRAEQRLQSREPTRSLLQCHQHTPPLAARDQSLISYPAFQRSFPAFYPSVRCFNANEALTASRDDSIGA